MKPRRPRPPDLADAPELHQRERARRQWRIAPHGQRMARYAAFKRATTAALRARA